MDTLLVAVVGGLLGGTVGALIGGLLSLVQQGREHSNRRSEAEAEQAHERRMAVEQRLQDRRARAYERILEYAYRLTLIVDRTEPLIGPTPEAPAWAGDEELLKLNA